MQEKIFFSSSHSFFHSDHFLLQNSSIGIIQRLLLFIFSSFNDLTVLFKDLIIMNITFCFSSSCSDYLSEYPPVYETLRLPQFYTL